MVVDSSDVPADRTENEVERQLCQTPLRSGAEDGVGLGTRACQQLVRGPVGHDICNNDTGVPLPPFDVSVPFRSQ